MDTIPRNYLDAALLMLGLMWLYFFVYSFQHKLGKPWGFGIVLVGVALSGFSYVIDNIAYFWVSVPFIIVLFGLLLNIVDIQNQIRIKYFKRTFFLSMVGLLFGLLAIPLMANQGASSNQGGVEFTQFAIVFGTIQQSITEEFLFRGFLLRYLRKYEFNIWFAILFQSLIFTALHSQRYSGNWMMLAVILMFGIMAGYLTWKSDNLIPASLLHVFVNVSWVVMIHIF